MLHVCASMYPYTLSAVSSFPSSPSFHVWPRARLWRNRVHSRHRWTWIARENFSLVHWTFWIQAERVDQAKIKHHSFFLALEGGIYLGKLSDTYWWGRHTQSWSWRPCGSTLVWKLCKNPHCEQKLGGPETDWFFPEEFGICLKRWTGSLQRDW